MFIIRGKHPFVLLGLGSGCFFFFNFTHRHYYKTLKIYIYYIISCLFLYVSIFTCIYTHIYLHHEFHILHILISQAWRIHSKVVFIYCGTP